MPLPALHVVLSRRFGAVDVDHVLDPGNLVLQPHSSLLVALRRTGLARGDVGVDGEAGHHPEAGARYTLDGAAGVAAATALATNACEYETIVTPEPVGGRPIPQSLRGRYNIGSIPPE